MTSINREVSKSELLDIILDSISKYGIKSIPASEKLFLNNLHSDNDISDNILYKYNERISNYHNLFASECNDIFFQTFIDERTQNELKYSILWEHLDNDDAFMLIKIYDLDTYFLDFEYHNLTDGIKNSFKDYMLMRYEIGS